MKLDTEDMTDVEVIDVFDADEAVRTVCSLSTGREDMEDGFFICDLGDVVQKHKKWKSIFPDIEPFYAMKCNPSETLLRAMIAMGTGFDCASKVEIKQILNLGASPKQIIFANPCKQSSHIKFARDNGVEVMVFDNEIELYKIKKCFPAAKLVLRIMTDDSAAICKFSMKYGAHADSCHMLIDTAKALDLDVIGVSFHVGSGCQDSVAYVKALQLAKEVFEYGTLHGYNMTLLDIGGGFPGSSCASLTVDEIAEVVNKTIEDLFRSVPEFKDVRVIAEPGRYYAASAFTLATNVIAKRKVARDKQGYKDDTCTKDAILNAVCPDTSEEPAFMYFLNDGLYGSFNCLFYDHAEVKPVLIKDYGKQCHEFSSSIWGPTCDGLDKVMEHCLLPELETGDWIVWKDMGAYTVAAGSAFNGFKTTSIYYVISRKDMEIFRDFCSDDMPKVNFITKNAEGCWDMCVAADRRFNGKEIDI